MGDSPSRLRHLEWLIGERVCDPEAIVYEILPYSPEQANLIICELTGLRRQRGRARLVREAFRLIVSAASDAQALLKLEDTQRQTRRSWRDLLASAELDGDRKKAATLRLAKKAGALQDDAGRKRRLDREIIVRGVSEAYQLLTGMSFGRSVTVELSPHRTINSSRSRPAGKPAGPACDSPRSASAPSTRILKTTL